MQLLKVSAKDGKPDEIVWGNEEEEVARWAAYDRIMVPAVALPPLPAGSLYVVQVTANTMNPLAPWSQSPPVHRMIGWKLGSGGSTGLIAALWFPLQLSLDPGALPFEAKYAGEIPGAEIEWFLQVMRLSDARHECLVYSGWCP